MRIAKLDTVLDIVQYDLLVSHAINVCNWTKRIPPSRLQLWTIGNCQSGKLTTILFLANPTKNSHRVINNEHWTIYQHDSEPYAPMKEVHQWTTLEDSVQREYNLTAIFDYNTTYSPIYIFNTSILYRARDGIPILYWKTRMLEPICSLSTTVCHVHAVHAARQTPWLVAIIGITGPAVGDHQSGTNEEHYSWGGGSQLISQHALYCSLQQYNRYRILGWLLKHNKSH